MLRDVVKLGAITAVGLGVVATVGVGVGIATLVVGVIFAGVSSAEDEKNRQPHGGSTPKMEERKLPKQAKPASPPPVQPSQEKRAAETTKQATPKPTTTDTPLESKSSDRPTERKSSLPNNKDEHKAPISPPPPPPTNAQPKPFNRTPESKTPATNNRDDRKAVTPTPNRQRSSSVLINKPGDSTASSSSAPKEGGIQRVVSPSSGVASQGKKPSPLSPDLEAQIAPEVKEWKNERPANNEPRKRGTATGRGSNEKRSSSALQAKTETVPVPEPAASVNVPGPLPLFPPAPIPRPKSKPHLTEPIVESQSKPESTPAPVAEQIKEDKAVLAQNIVSPGEVSLSKPGDRLSVPARNSQSEAPVSSQESEPRRDLDVSPSSSAVASAAPVEQSAFLPPDAILAATASSLLPLSMKLDPEPSNTSSLLPAKDLNNVVPNGFGVLQGPASASRDSLPSIQQRNSKITSAAKKVKHTVKRVFKGPDGKAIIHSTDPQRLTSSSSDSIDSQRIFVGDLDQGRTISKLASESRESVASTKSRRSLIDGTKKGLKRMFKGSSDNIEVPPVPPLPIVVPAAAPEPSVNDRMMVSESTPAPKPTKVGQQADAGNNVSPLLKEMFKGRKKPRGRR